MFGWLRSRRRRVIRERPWPPAWDEILARNVRQMQWLAEEERERLRAWVAVFLAEKRFEGCRGMEIDDDVRVSIAGQAGLIVLGMPDEFFDQLQSVLVYPGDYFGKRSTPLEGGGELQWREPRLGETWNGGSMVLSWPRVVEGGRLRDGPRSVVIHECAHREAGVDAGNCRLPGAVCGGPRRGAVRRVRRLRRRGSRGIFRRRQRVLLSGSAPAPSLRP
jgi:Mlc titration factor MtfA (ptsG expression regulator)